MNSPDHDLRFAGSLGQAWRYPKEHFRPSQIRAGIAFLGLSDEGFAVAAQVDLVRLRAIQSADDDGRQPLFPSERLLIERRFKEFGIQALPSVAKGSGVRWVDSVRELSHRAWLLAQPPAHRVV